MGRTRESLEDWKNANVIEEKKIVQKKVTKTKAHRNKKRKESTKENLDTEGSRPQTTSKSMVIEGLTEGNATKVICEDEQATANKVLPARNAPLPAQGERLFALLGESEERPEKVYSKPLMFDETEAECFAAVYEDGDRLGVWETYYCREYGDYLTGSMMKTKQLASNNLTTPVKKDLLAEIKAIDQDKISLDLLLTTATKLDSGTKESQSAALTLGSQIYRGCFCKRRKAKMTSVSTFKRHPDLGWNMRIMVVDWMKEFAANLRLKRSTFHLSVAIFDAYLQTAEDITRDKLQFLAAISLLLASKLDDSIMSLADLSFLSTKPSSMSDAKALEFNICKVGHLHPDTAMAIDDSESLLIDHQSHAMLGLVPRWLSIASPCRS